MSLGNKVQVVEFSPLMNVDTLQEFNYNMRVGVVGSHTPTLKKTDFKEGIKEIKLIKKIKN